METIIEALEEELNKINSDIREEDKNPGDGKHLNYLVGLKNGLETSIKIVKENNDTH